MKSAVSIPNGRADPLVCAGPPGPALDGYGRKAGQGAGRGPGGPPHQASMGQWGERQMETIDSLAGKIPRGSITEIFGAASTGRTTALLSIVAAATAREECCAFVDAQDALDPASAAAGGIDLQRLLWVRCAGNPEHALKAADLLVHAGGFGVVALDLADVEPQIVRRIPLTSWFRLRRAVENTPTVLVILEQEPYVKTCASLILEMKRDGVAWSGNLLQNASFQPVPRKPAGQAGRSRFEAEAVG